MRITPRIKGLHETIRVWITLVVKRHRALKSLPVFNVSRESLTMRKVLVVGTISNAERNFNNDLLALKKALRGFQSVKFFLVESDSRDSTVKILNECKFEDENFDFISLGILKNSIPDRIERIRFCRNKYVEEIRRTQRTQDWDFVIVADMDGMNRAISESAIQKTLNSNKDWDACFANQTFGYYDVFALRATNWLEENCFSTLNRLKSNKPFVSRSNSGYLYFLEAFQHFDKLRVEAIYSKMKRINPSDDWIRVNSAFGGLGIYRPQLFLNFDYSFQQLEPGIYSEHLDFHLKCVANGANFFINPKLINARLNEYNLNRLKLVRFAREFRKFLRNGV